MDTFPSNDLILLEQVLKDEFLATISDQYGTMRFKARAPNDGYIINVNHSPMVYQGDAIFHISTTDSNIAKTEEREN